MTLFSSVSTATEISIQGQDYIVTTDVVLTQGAFPRGRWQQLGKGGGSLRRKIIQMGLHLSTLYFHWTLITWERTLRNPSEGGWTPYVVYTTEILSFLRLDRGSFAS